MGRILVVDDQKISRLTLSRILEEGQHTVRAEATGPAGIRAAREWLPDTIILDVHMPDMDGFEVVEQVKKDALTAAIPVVFLTGEPPTDELIVRGLELGAYDFISKGCSKAELLARVSVMERIKRGHDEMSAIARISDALLRSVDPEILGRQFTRETRGVFRADGVCLGLERGGRFRLRQADGIDIGDDALTALLEAVGRRLDQDQGAVAEILEPSEIEGLVDPAPGVVVGSMGIACDRRSPSTAVVAILARSPGAFRPHLDGPLLRRLSSQAAVAIEHALLNEQARRQADDLAAAMNERSRFFASLSHELRTPINAVIGYNHLLQEKIFGELSDRQVEALSKANRSARHLLELVDDILDISKIEAGKLEVLPQDFDLADLLEDTATSLQLQAEEKGIGLEIRSPGSVGAHTDPARVRQIVLNLLSNAVKFTESGGVVVRLELRDDTRVAISVRDTGPGIAPEHQERIFDEFEQGAASADGTGTGLGLAISKRLAELLGGALSVESELGHGATFTLVLPRRWTPPEADDWTRS